MGQLSRRFPPKWDNFRGDHPLIGDFSRRFPPNSETFAEITPYLEYPFAEISPPTFTLSSLPLDTLSRRFPPTLTLISLLLDTSFAEISPYAHADLAASGYLFRGDFPLRSR
jgi:hypothetical protein